MEKYSISERTQIVKLFYQNCESIISTQRAYRRHYQVRNAPSDNAIRSIVRRFEQQGVVTDLPRTGRPRNVRTDENRERVRESVEETATTSTRRRSTELWDIPSCYLLLLYLIYKITILRFVCLNSLEATG